MNNKKRTFNNRAFVSMMAGLTGIILPVSGLVLHIYSDHQMVAGKHPWFMMHVVSGILFLGIAVWHVVLNRAIFLKFLKSKAFGPLPLSREACLAVPIAAGLVFLIMSLAN